MHEITGATAVNNHFVDGVSGTQTGTVVTADWLNTVQDEICNLIRGVGIKLNPQETDTKMQLKEGVTKLAENLIDTYVKDNDLAGLSARVDKLTLNLQDNYTLKSDFDAISPKIDAITNSLSNYALKSDLGDFSEKISWCVTWIENIEGIKYPALPTKNSVKGK